MRWNVVLLFLAGLVACGETSDPSKSGGAPMASTPEEYETNDGLRWGTADDPSIFTPDLKVKIAELPMEGQAERIPWPSTYWATYLDSINARWDGNQTQSPTEKYQSAFGGTDVPGKVSTFRGIAGYTDRKECSVDSDCNATLSESCGKRIDESKGRCIPTWWGICHDWAPASIMEPEPVNPVTLNGVTFKVNDIKALVMIMYERAYTKFVSLRCDESSSQGQVEYDKYGRPTGSDVQCLDTNPGTFHIIATNYLGLRRQSFVEDRTWDDEVWNQPVRGYKINQLKEVTAAEANALVGATAEGGQTTTATGKVSKDQWAHQGPYNVSAGTKVKVVMTGTNDADLYVRFGSQPTASAYDCRPYAGGSEETCELTAPAGATKVYVSVQGYQNDSTFNLTSTVGGSVPTTYLFNPDARRFYHVKMEFKYIGESAASTDGNLAHAIDQYTHEDNYEYVLEVDGLEKIVGGEWVGASKKAHPDFLWVPTGRRYSSVASGALEWSKISDILQRSLGGATGGGGAQPATVNESGTLAQGVWKHYGPYNVASGALTAVLSGGGDADLYVKKGAQPTTSAYDCRPYASGSSETCTVAGPGAIYVSVRGYAASSAYGLKVTYQAASGGTAPAVAHLNVSDSVGYQQGKVYKLAVPAGRKIVVRTLAPGDVDVYLRMNAEPAGSTYDAAGTGYTGNETVSFTPATAGDLYVRVYGYAASTFTLTTADN